MTRFPAHVVVLAVLTVPLLTGCYVERPCGDGQYPIRPVEGAGGACLSTGQPLPSGWTTYEPGHTPTVAGRTP